LKKRKKRTGKEKKMERVLEKLKTNDEFEQAIADAVVKQCEQIPAFIDKQEREGKIETKEELI
jgi:hypothetical protein